MYRPIYRKASRMQSSRSAGRISTKPALARYISYGKRSGFGRYSKKSYRRLPFRTSASRAHAVYQLNPCIKDFLKAQFNPWGEFTTPPCIPDLLAMPSYKVSYFAKGQFASSGTTGIGFICLNPYMIFGHEGGGHTNNFYSSPILYTDQSYPRGDISTTQARNWNFTGTNPSFSGMPVGENPAYWNSPWISDATMNANIQAGAIDWRLVGAGLKVKYAGAALTRKGVYILYEDPTNYGVIIGTVGSSTPKTWGSADLMKEATTSQVAIDEREHCVLWHPRTNGDLDYFFDNLQTSINTSIEDRLTGYDNLLIGVFNGDTTEDAGVFTWEAIAHYEFVGPLTPDRTKTHSDIQGMSKVLNLFDSKVPTTSASAQYFDKFKQLVKGMGRPAINAAYQSFRPTIPVGMQGMTDFMVSAANDRVFQ